MGSENGAVVDPQPGFLGRAVSNDVVGIVSSNILFREQLSSPHEQIINPSEQCVQVEIL